MLERFKTWYAFLGGAIAWTLHLMGGYGLSEMVCLMQESASALPWILGSLTFVALALSGGALLLSRRMQLQSFAKFAGQADEILSFMARTSLISNAFFTAVILAQTLPLIIFRGQCS